MTQLTIIDVFFFPYDTMIFGFVKSEIRRQKPPYLPVLLLTERLAVSTLIRSGIGFMGADQNPLQRTEICILAVMLTLLNGTFNTLVCMAIHNQVPPFLLGWS